MGMRPADLTPAEIADQLARMYCADQGEGDDTPTAAERGTLADHLGCHEEARAAAWGVWCAELDPGDREAAEYWLDVQFILTAAVKAVGTQGLLAKDQVINLGSVKVTVLPPPPGMPKTEQNLNSVGLLIQYGAFRALMTGDSETAETAAGLKKYPASTLGPIDVYKSIHHGARNGDNPAWLAAVRPTNVVVSVGPNNYGHPTSEALALYKSVGTAIYRTDLNGTVTVQVQPGGKYTLAAGTGTGTTPRVAPPRVTPPATSAVPATVPSSVTYSSCAAVRAARKSPLLAGQPRKHGLNSQRN